MYTVQPQAAVAQRSQFGPCLYKFVREVIKDRNRLVA